MDARTLLDPSPRLNTLDLYAGGKPNPACWLRGVDTTGLVVNVGGGPNRCGYAITPRHVTCATHDPLRLGDVVALMTKSGEIVERAVVRVDTIESLCVGTLNAALPSTIRPVKIPANDYTKFLPTSGPLIRINQLNQATIAQAYYIGTGGVLWRDPADPVMLRYYKKAVDGDSGRFIGVLAGDELVALGNATGYFAGFFIPVYADRLARVVAPMQLRRFTFKDTAG